MKLKQIILALNLIWTIVSFAQSTTNYQYDNYNRLDKSSSTNTIILYDFDELNNRTLYTVTPQGTQQADLLVENINVPSNSFDQGESISVSCDVSNIGTVDATGSYLRVYLANSATGTDIELASKYVSMVSVAGSVSLSINITIPIDAPLGNKFLVFFADATEVIDEPNSDNNKANSLVIIQTHTLVDIAVQNQQASPTSLYAGENVNLSANIDNIGNGNAGSFWFRCYLSINPTFESYLDTELTEAAYNYSSLNAGSTLTYNRSVNVPSNTVPGVYYLLFVADREGVLTELDTGNNLGYVSLTVADQSGGNAPVVDFSSDAQLVLAESNVQFEDESTNNPTSWQWSFPGGTPSSSTLKDPSVAYNYSGTYDVSLVTSNANGQSQQTNVEYIDVYTTDIPAPINFSYTSSNDTLFLNWTKVTDGNTYDYIIYYADDTPVNLNSTNVNVGDVNTYTFTGLDQEPFYQFMIVAKNASDQLGEPSGILNVDLGVYQTHNLNAGWNLIGFYTEPFSLDIEDVFAPVFDQVLQIKTETEFYVSTLPPFLNTLKTIQNAKGYWIQVETACQFTVRGKSIDINSISIQLNQGWNLISYPTQTPEEIDVALNSIFDKIIQVKHIYEFYHVDLPPFLNTLDELNGERGYWIEVTEDCLLTY